MTNILKLTLKDVSTLGADETVVLQSGETIFTNDYPLHSREREHLRQLANLHVASLRKKSEEELEAPLHHFLYYGDNGKVRLSPIKYKFWLERHNFAKFFPVNSKTYTFIKIDGKLIEETNEKWIKEYVLNELKTTAVSGDYSFYDYMASNEKYFDSKFLSMLESSKVEFQQDTKDTCYLYYQNCIVKVTADSVEKINYKDVDNYVWKNQVIQREYEFTDHKDSEFRQFLYCVSGHDMKKYKSIQSVVGYLLHGYKNKANNRAIILNDAVISDNPDGGSGKGLFCTAISHMKKLDALDGKDVDFTRQFKNQTVRMDCQVLAFEDVKPNFNFENLFSVITEGITIEYKNQPAVRLPVEKSPKIIITTNYTIGGMGGSHERRKFEVEFSDFFKDGHTPYDYFGRMLFDEWDRIEWCKYDNHLIKSLQVYLKDGLIKCDFDNIDVKKFMRNVGMQFYEWTKNHDFMGYNQQVKKSVIWGYFFESYPDSKKYYGDKKQIQCMEAYCKYYGGKYTDGNTRKNNLGRWMMIESDDKLNAAILKANKEESEIPNIPFFDPNESAF
jgi:hypothetical protein